MAAPTPKLLTPTEGYCETRLVGLVVLSVERLKGIEALSQIRSSQCRLSAVDTAMKIIQTADRLAVAAPGTAETGMAWSKVAKDPWCFTASANR